ncbi:MAG: tetratricopeptide repeat protein [Phycisphaerae bacterium]|nr:tetratricopeptide repeat protein [Phycisphaerae bacterium]
MKCVPAVLIRQVCVLGCLSVLAGPVFSADSPDIESARQSFRQGDYAKCISDANSAMSNWERSDEWACLQINAMMSTGQYKEAALAAMTQLRNYPRSLSVPFTAYHAFQHNGQADLAQMMLQQIYRSASVRQLAFLPAKDQVSVGRTLLLLGGEPKLILDEFFTKAQRKDPNDVEAYLAAGDLALAKQDYELAATQFRKALERFGDEPRAHYGLAKAFYYSDRKAMLLSLDAALLINSNHADSLLLLAEHQIDAENYEGAEALLKRLLDVNPWHPEAWALRCVISHLTNDAFAIAPNRSRALKFWKDNPAVDHLIGRKLSQRYWFAKGAEYQEKALEFDSRYAPARAQLAEDLLRLGNEKGWSLANAVYQADQYNVQAYNMVTLRDHMAKFTTLTDDNLIIRMDPQEAGIYGDRVMALLKRAKTQLSQKYGLVLDKPITLELFKNQQDFAVRTFGMPGGDGYLGVCFGDVITANSPKLELRSNWQATLWHEFCHVVTLNLTNNKMPRWLSEGLSVYEERQHDPAWGQRMTPQYRSMILGGDLTPITHLSSAFMSPPTSMHMQFAYYESSLAVEYLVSEYGMDAIKAILKDLGEGEEINAVIEKHTTALDRLEQGFAAFARAEAEGLAKDVDWDQPAETGPGPVSAEVVTQWLTDHPNSFWALTLQAGQFMAEQQWESAKAPLKRLIELYPAYTGEGNAYAMLAQVYRQLDETQEERAVLMQWIQHSADATEAYLRLMRMDAKEGQWASVLEQGERYLAVYPMLGEVHRLMAQAAQALMRPDQAVASYENVLALDPADPAQVHYQLARLLVDKDSTQAKRHVLEALADAPRFREAHQLLLQLSREGTP